MNISIKSVISALFALAHPVYCAPVSVPALDVAGASTAPSATDANADIKLDPMILLSAAERVRLRFLVANDPAAQALFAPMRARADQALGREPSPVAEIDYEGRIKDDPKRVATQAALQDMQRLRDLCYAAAATGEEPYAASARRYALSWARTAKPTGNPINMNKLDALPVALAHVAWPDAGEKREVEAWVRAMAESIIAQAGREAKGNWHSKRLKLTGVAGVVLGDAKFSEWTRQEYRRYVGSSIAPDGESFDFKQRDALSYHTGGLVPLLEVAIAVRGAGDDLYAFATPEGASARKAVDFLLPYARGAKTHAEWINSKVKFDRERWEAGDDHYKPGLLWDRFGALKTIELAAFFDPGLRSLVSELSRADKGNRYGTWLGLLVATRSENQGNTGSNAN